MKRIRPNAMKPVEGSLEKPAAVALDNCYQRLRPASPGTLADRPRPGGPANVAEPVEESRERREDGEQPRQVVSERVRVVLVLQRHDAR